MRTAKTLIRLGGCQADLSLRWAHSHIVGFVVRRLKCFRLVSDLIDQHGNLYTFDNFKTIFGVAGTFLDYQSGLAKIPDQWKM